MRKSFGPAWEALTDGTNGAIVSPEGTLLLYIGANAPTAADYGMPFTNEKITITAPTKAWVMAAGQVPVMGIMFNL